MFVNPIEYSKAEMDVRQGRVRGGIADVARRRRRAMRITAEVHRNPR